MVHHFWNAHVLQRVEIVLLFIQFTVAVEAYAFGILIISFPINAAFLIGS